MATFGAALVAVSEAVGAPREARLVEKAGRVVVTKAGARAVPAEVGVGLVARDKLGTGEASRAVLRMSERWYARIDEETDVEITPGSLSAKDKDSLKLLLGGAFIFSREEEGELKIQTPSAVGGLRGTQVMVRVLPDGTTRMQVLEGAVDLANEFGAVSLGKGEAGEAEVGKAPRRTAVIDARNLLQWALYYPAVLVAEEIALDETERSAVAASLAAYRQGDLVAALAAYPTGGGTGSPAAQLYHAAVLLATGRVDPARTALARVPATHPGRRALDRMIAAVLFHEQAALPALATASEALAESYYQQSRARIEEAHRAALRSVALAPTSGYAWTRCAELEFSLGRLREAERSLAKGIEHTPRNAQAHALRGYMLSARNRIAAAQASFEHAVRLDGGLSNGWLGLGLTKIKQGRRAEGRADLQTAATVEPTRALLYSYHGKALDLEGAGHLAQKDFALAKQLDPADPTPWLYAALQLENDRNPGAAIAELQQSIQLNHNRRVYRSRLLLDQDRAVRSANLARIYRHNGMTDVAVREASFAVEADYTNPSAHLFLAQSFDALRDPRRIALRHETAWFNEQLLAGLLMPVGGGPLSHFVSQQEYSRLLDADGFGGALATEWHDDGFFDHQVSVSATGGRLGAGVDFGYQRDRGTRPNHDWIRREGYGQVNFQATADDVGYLLGKWQHDEGGDLRQNYHNRPGNAGLRLDEKHEPGVLLLGWNHRWGPGAHTLWTAARLAGRQHLTAPRTTQLLLARSPAGLGAATLPRVDPDPNGALRLTDEFLRSIAPFVGQGRVTETFTDEFDFATTRTIEIYSTEAQQLWQTARNLLLIGARFQAGEIDAQARLDVVNPAIVPYFPSPAALSRVEPRFERQSIYAYDFLHVTPSLTLLGGLAADWIERPENFRNPPLSQSEVRNDKVSSKFGFTYATGDGLRLRGIYTEALGGVTFDENVRLEPVQLAGFNQAFRTVISESVAGSVEAPAYRNAGLSIEGAMAARTWWAASVNVIFEEVSRELGAFDVLTTPAFPAGRGVLPSRRREQLAYREATWTAGVNRLFAHGVALAGSYRGTRARLRTTAPEIPTTVDPFAVQRDDVTLHEVRVSGHWNSPSGWFAGAETAWYRQTIAFHVAGQRRDTVPGDRFWQWDVRVGRRLQRNRHEFSAGVLNATDEDYRLNPLTYHREFPRTRTWFVRSRLGF